MTTLYPSDTCIPPVSIARTHRECHLENLLRDCLPYLVKVELSPSTSSVLRSLIAEIQELTD